MTALDVLVPMAAIKVVCGLALRGKGLLTSIVTAVESLPSRREDFHAVVLLLLLVYLLSLL